MIEVLTPGVLTTLQDQGRWGYGHLGISVAGVMDLLSMRVANLLVDNPEESSVLEMALLSPIKLKFKEARWIAITGSPCQLLIDNKETFPPYWRFLIKKGAVLTLKPTALSGSFAYLAVNGGFISPTYLGSSSTDIKNRLGGLQGDGTPLQKGATLLLGSKTTRFSCPIGLTPFHHLNLGLLNTIKTIAALKGPEYSTFTQEAHTSFWQTSWHLTQSFNRHGILLSGASLDRHTKEEIPSQGVFFGVIQVPYNGQPILLAAECQSTGGYPRIAIVPQAEVWKLIHLKPHDTIQFQQITLNEAKKRLQRQNAYLNHLRTYLPPTHYPTL